MTVEKYLRKLNFYSIFDIIDWLDEQIESCNTEELIEFYNRMRMTLIIEMHKRSILSDT